MAAGFAHTADEWRFAARETIVARANAQSTVFVRRQTAHLVVHSSCERAVNRLPPDVAVRPDMMHSWRTSRLSS
eukprot:7061402-Prymnesium_polylepis.1